VVGAGCTFYTFSIATILSCITCLFCLGGAGGGLLGSLPCCFCLPACCMPAGATTNSALLLCYHSASLFPSSCFLHFCRVGARCRNNSALTFCACMCTTCLLGAFLLLPATLYLFCPVYYTWVDFRLFLGGCLVPVYLSQILVGVLGEGLFSACLCLLTFYSLFLGGWEFAYTLLHGGLMTMPCMPFLYPFYSLVLLFTILTIPACCLSCHYILLPAILNVLTYLYSLSVYWCCLYFTLQIPSVLQCILLGIPLAIY
jgi:hypothetical protein